MASFFKKYSRDVVYLCVIAGLVGWMFFNPQRKQDQMLFEELSRSMRFATSQINLQILNLYTGIQREVSAFPEKHEKTWGQTRQIRSLIQSAEINVREKTSHLYKGLHIQNAIEDKALREIQQDVRLLADSLIFLIDNKPDLVEIINRALYSDSAAYSNPNWAALSSSAEPTRIEAGLENLILCINSAGNIAMQYCFEKVAPVSELDGCLAWYPVLSTPRTTLRPGELFKADIYLAPLLERNNPNVAVYVDNKPFKFEHGTAPFQRRFNTPGIHEFEVRIDLTNPYTKEVKPFTKTFEVLVVEPCLETR